MAILVARRQARRPSIVLTGAWIAASSVSSGIVSAMCGAVYVDIDQQLLWLIDRNIVCGSSFREHRVHRTRANALRKGDGQGASHASGEKMSVYTHVGWCVGGERE